MMPPEPVQRRIRDRRACGNHRGAGHTGSTTEPLDDNARAKEGAVDERR